MFRHIFYIFTVLILLLDVPNVPPSHAQDASERYDRAPLNNRQLDYDNPSLEAQHSSWYSFGCQWVSYEDEDRLVFHVPKQAGAFKKIQVKVGSDAPYFIKAKVFLRHGRRKKFNIASNKSFPGQGVEIKFSHVAKEIKRIVLRYDARMRAGDRTKICVSGQKTKTPWSSSRSRSRPFVQNEEESRDGKWQILGCVKLGSRFSDDYIQIEKNQSKLEAVRFFVKRSPVIIDTLELTYQNGTKQALNAKRHGRLQQKSKTFKLKGRSRLSAIDIRSRSRSLFKDARICFQGLVSDDEKGPRREDRPFVQKYPREAGRPFADREERRFADNNKGEKEQDNGRNERQGQSSDLDDYINSTKKQRELRKRRLKEEGQEGRKKRDLEQSTAEAQAQEKARKSAQRRAEAEVKKLQEQNNKTKNSALDAAQKRAEEAKKRAEQFRRVEAQAQAREQEAKQRAAQELAKQDLARGRAEAKNQADVELSQQEAEARAESEEAERKRLEALRAAEALEERERAEAAEEAKKQAEAEVRAQEQVEKQRLAELQKQAEKRLAAKNKIHSKKADFPKSKITPSKRGWINYGCQQFGSTIEELYIPVGRMQGTFTKIRVKAMKNSLTLKKMIVVYGNGQEEPLIRYSSRVRMGEYTSEYKLSHKRRFISEVKLKAQSRDYQNPAKVLVCLEAYR